MSGCDHVVGSECNHAIGYDGMEIWFASWLNKAECPALFNPFKFCPYCGAPLSDDWRSELPKEPGNYYWRRIDDKNECYLLETGDGEVWCDPVDNWVDAVTYDHGEWLHVKVSGPDQ